MKLFTKILIILCCIFLYSCKNDRINNICKNDLIKKNLKGSVKNLIEETSVVEYNCGIKKDTKVISKSQFEYNKNGYLIEMITNDDRYGEPNMSGIEMKYLFQYNLQNNRTLGFQYDSKGNLMGRTIYELNNENLVNKAKSYISIPYLTVDPITKKDKYNIDTAKATKKYLHKINLWKYDNNKNVIETRWLSRDSVFRNMIKEKYDEQNNCTERIYYNINDSLFSFRYKFEYNENGQLFREIHYSDNSDTTGITVIYKYDKFNNVVEENSKDNHTRLTTIVTYSYEKFDKCNNWLKCTKSIDGEQTNIINRKIQYY